MACKASSESGDGQGWDGELVVVVVVVDWGGREGGRVKRSREGASDGG